MRTEANQNPKDPFFKDRVFVDSLPTQSSLISKLKYQDADAWGQFVDVYAPLIFQWCRSNALSQDDSADVTQNVFAKLHRSIEKYDRQDQASFRSWLWVVTRNAIRDFCRKKSRDVKSEGGTEFNWVLANLPSPADDPTSDHGEELLLERALKVVESVVDANTWRAFWLVTMEHRSTESVARELEMPKNGVRQAKSRVLRRLRELLEQK